MVEVITMDVIGPRLLLMVLMVVCVACIVVFKR